MKKTILGGLLLLFALQASAYQEENKEVRRFEKWAVGINLGYAFPYEDWLSQKKYHHRDEIYFTEKGTLIYNLGLNLQYYFSRTVGVRLDYGYQRADYSAHLEWYGRWIEPIAGGGELIYIPIGHIEEPYTSPADFHSVVVSLILKYPPRKSTDRLTPYVSFGYGYHFLSADREKVLDRWRLGPAASETTYRIAVGLKYRLTDRLNLTANILGQNFYRKYGQSLVYAGYTGEGLNVNPREQLDFDYYWATGQVVRDYDALANTITFLGLQVGLEFVLFHR